MKRCPKCYQVFEEEALKFCRSDGTPLVTTALDEAVTISFPTQQVSPVSPRLLPETPSIAVLPLTNLTSDPANDYVCEGLAEGLVLALSRIENLKVAGRTSAFSFKDKEVDVRQIGNALHVDAVVEGSVRTSANRMRITVQLVSARDGFQIWSERFDLDVHDLLNLQNEITRALADALHIKLRSHEQATVLKQHTQNPKAHELYLQGRFHANR
jgi:adenylate cyclase